MLKPQKITFMVFSLLCLSAASSHAQEERSILTYPETKVLCETIHMMNSGPTTLGFLKKYAQKVPSKRPKDFLDQYASSILCYGRPLIYFTIYKGHPDDIQALLDAGHDVNKVIEDNLSRKMTMLDYVKIVYNEEDNPIYKALVKDKMMVIRRARGKTCLQLGQECQFKKIIPSRSIN